MGNQFTPIYPRWRESNYMTVNINITKRDKIIIDPNTGQKIDSLPRPGQPNIVKPQENELNDNKQ